MVEDAFQEVDEEPVPPSTLEEKFEDIVMGAFTTVDELAHDDHKYSDDELEDEVLGENGGSIGEQDNYGNPHELEEAIEARGSTPPFFFGNVRSNEGVL
jgi:hypothetical protein